MKRGFTLVELSIVLVIIGLLIGGILVAQSMINAAKIQGFIRQIQQIDAGVSNFKTKYSSLPGDSKVMAPAGDGNGQINSANPQAFDGEVSTFWIHLSQTGFGDGSLTYTQTITGGKLDITPPTLNALPSILGKDTAILAIYDTFNGPAANTYLISNEPISAPTDLLPVDSVPSVDALAVDTKLDDALPGSGNITSSTGSGSSACRTVSAYSTLSSGKCSLYIKMTEN